MFAIHSVHFSCSVAKLKVRKNACFWVGVGVVSCNASSIVLNIFTNNYDLNAQLNV